MNIWGYKMSYMNDDCDPFGIPYNTSNMGHEKIKKSYSFNDLKEIAEEEWELCKKMDNIKKDKSDAIEHLKNKIKKYFFGSNAKIECDRNYDWKIITDSFKLSQLEKLKEDFDLKDIKIKCDKIKCGEVYHEKIIIKLVI